MGTQKRFTQAELGFIRANYTMLPLNQIQKALNRISGTAICEAGKRMGIASFESLRPRTKSSRSYCSWASMIQRCTNPKSSNWENYGGRGISVCKRWRSFTNFLKDMGEKPKKGEWSIDRINPNGNYTPKNCRWLKTNEQARTTRKYLSTTDCFICKSARGNRRGRCHKCNEYLRRHGHERPSTAEHLPKRVEQPPKECSNCKVPSKPVCHGRCTRCYQYFRWKGSERPSRLWTLTPTPSK